MEKSQQVLGNFVILSGNPVIHVPREIAVCPYCDSPLAVTLEEWEEDRDTPGFWTVGQALDLECITEPDIEDTSDDDYNEWDEVHSRMPYVFWLPIEEKVRAWLKENFRWKMELDEVIEL